MSWALTRRHRTSLRISSVRGRIAQGVAPGMLPGHGEWVCFWIAEVLMGRKAAHSLFVFIS